MTGTDRIRLRQTFTEDADLYDRARPGYPRRLFDELTPTGLPGPGPGCRVLEIGCGTGQATVALAERGCSVLAVELGAELARVARRNLAPFPEVEVVTADFETWPLPAEPFDLVFAATSYHWIDPATRVAKSADALRPGGALVIIETHHVAGGTEEFFADVQNCYERFDPATPPGLRLSPADDIPRDDTELVRSGRFAPATFRRYEYDIPYTTREYLDVLSTYSGHRALPAAARDGLLSCIGALIDGRYGGRIVKRYLAQVRSAVRVR